MKARERLQVRKKESERREKTTAAVIEVEMLKKEGDIVWLEVSSKPVIGPDGTLVGFQGITREITDRKHAEEALRESEERYRLLVNELPDYIIVHRDGELLYVNTSIAKSLGYLPEELLHTSMFDYVAPECRNVFMQFAEMRREGASLLPYEVKIITRDGSIRWVEIRGALITFEGRQASLNVLTDITEKKFTEKALSDNERKFRTLADFTYDWEYQSGQRKSLFTPHLPASGLPDTTRKNFTRINPSLSGSFTRMTSVYSKNILIRKKINLTRKLSNSGSSKKRGISSGLPISASQSTVLMANILAGGGVTGTSPSANGQKRHYGRVSSAFEVLLIQTSLGSLLPDPRGISSKQMTIICVRSDIRAKNLSMGLSTGG